MHSHIQHDAARMRFSTSVDGHEAVLVYSLHQGTLAIDHTGVPPAIAGRGVAGGLVKAALEHARARGLRVQLACPYSAAYVQRHPEYADLVD